MVFHELSALERRGRYSYGGQQAAYEKYITSLAKTNKIALITTNQWYIVKNIGLPSLLDHSINRGLFIDVFNKTMNSNGNGVLITKIIDPFHTSPMEIMNCLRSDNFPFFVDHIVIGDVLMIKEAFINDAAIEYPLVNDRSDSPIRSRNSARIWSRSRALFDHFIRSIQKLQENFVISLFTIDTKITIDRYMYEKFDCHDHDSLVELTPK